MKSLIVAAALSLVVAAPAFAQSATQAVTDAVADAAAKAATDAVKKSVTGEAGDKKVKKDKDGPNYGRSEEHRQDDQGHKGKKKNKK